MKANDYKKTGSWCSPKDRTEGDCWRVEWTEARNVLALMGKIPLRWKCIGCSEMIKKPAAGSQWQWVWHPPLRAGGCSHELTPPGSGSTTHDEEETSDVNSPYETEELTKKMFCSVDWGRKLGTLRLWRWRVHLKWTLGDRSQKAVQGKKKEALKLSCFCFCFSEFGQGYPC